ncbi:phosphoesterase [Synergistales bacterium]|nr:phosphoesterase [Synergistales bacterium]
MDEAREIRQILDVMSGKDKWLVLAHTKPDGDTCGCASAIAKFGMRIGKEVTVGCTDPPPPIYTFLFEDIDCREMESLSDEFTNAGCLIICVDTSNTERAVGGISEAASRCEIINIDHHSDNSKYGSINWIDSHASATGEMITELLSASEWGIAKSEADSLYVAIVTDNGHFRFSSTSARSHECAIKLINAGISLNAIDCELDATLSTNALKLMARAFSRTETFADGLCALFWLSQKDFTETNTTRNDKENIVNVLLRIKGVQIAAMCSEQDDGVRVNLRARVPFSVHDIAARFGGGGHPLASGCTIKTPLPDALSLLRDEMTRYAAPGVHNNK